MAARPRGTGRTAMALGGTASDGSFAASAFFFFCGVTRSRYPSRNPPHQAQPTPSPGRAQ